MKRIITILLLTLGIVYLQAQIATLSLPCLGVQPAGQIYVPIKVDTINSDVLTIQLYVQYNSAHLTYDHAEQFHPNFPEAEWIFVDVGGETGINWMGADMQPEIINPGESFCTLVYIYDGVGYSDLILYGGLGGFLIDSLTFINGCVGPGCICGLNIWTGNIDENWDNSGNWSKGSVPVAENVEIPDVGKAPFPVIYFPGALTDSLTIYPNASLTIAPGGDLTTNGLFTNDGLFLIQSDENGLSGSFINNESIAGNGIFEFDRHITNSSPSSDPFNWHFLSSPVQEFYSDDIPDYFINKWDELIGTYQFIQGIPCTPADPPVILNLMEGWSIKLDPDYISNCGFGTGEIIEIQGNEFNSGVYSVPFSYTIGMPFAGWNLLGNPYPCSIDPLLIDWHENLNQSIYLYDGRLNNFFAWAGGVGPQSIPPTQGFFVNAISDGTFTFSGDERIHDTENTWFKSDIENLLTLKATTNGNEFYDLTHIRFLEEATSDFDKEWDAYKLLSNTPEVPQIYSSTEDDILSINTKPAIEMVPLAFITEQSGTFTIEAIETSDFADVMLEDLFTGTLTDLLVNSYTFDYTAGDDPDRFIIHFTPVGFQEYEASNIKKIWSNEHNIYVNILNSSDGYILVYNFIGQEITKKDIEPGLNVIPVHEVNTFYLVRVVTSADAVTAKVYIR